MGLSNDLISEFVKVTNDKREEKKETIVYGTTVLYEGKTYVKIDGSDILTPISTTADTQPGERVTVMIKNHTATITGNMSSPSARSDDVKGMGSEYQKLSDKIDTFEILVADKVDTEALNAITGRIDYLVSDNTVIRQNLTAAEADISDLKAENVTINEKLTAVEADVENLKTEKLDAEIADITYATITNLNAVNVDVHNLESRYADFESTTTTKLNAHDASIDDLQVKKLDVETAEMTYVKISDLTAATADITNLEGEFSDFEVSTTNKLAAQDAEIEDLKTNKLSASDFVYHEPKILWGEDLTSGMYMTAGHTANLTEAVSAQRHGIILVFCAYDGRDDTNYSWQSFFVPKQLVALSTSGHTFVLGRGKFTYIGTKYLYIGDTAITGHADNNLTGTANGITYDNNKFVLRYVIGV